MIKLAAGACAAAAAAPLLVILLVVAGPAAPPAVKLTAPSGLSGAATAAAEALIPADYLTWYMDAAQTCPGLPWSVLAGIGTVESDNGQSNLPGVHSGANFAGAEGPMQFEPSTFAEFATGPDKPLSPYDPADAIYTAAAMLCASGARGGTASGIEDRPAQDMLNCTDAKPCPATAPKTPSSVGRSNVRAKIPRRVGTESVSSVTTIARASVAGSLSAVLAVCHRDSSGGFL